MMFALSTLIIVLVVALTQLVWQGHNIARMKQRFNQQADRLVDCQRDFDSAMKIGEEAITNCDRWIVFWHSTNAAKDLWKDLALSLEVLCECCADSDGSGAANARDSIQQSREMLRLLGEYDA